MQKKFCLSFSGVVEEILQGCCDEKNLGKSFFVKLLTTLKKQNWEAKIWQRSLANLIGSLE